MIEYQVGGSLAVDDPTYVDRAADAMLYNALLQREFCYVLTSRQMGKSSLRVQVRHRLQSTGEGRCAAINMARIGSPQLTQEQWYQGLALDIARKLDRHRQFNLHQGWHDLGDRPPVQKLSHFIETVLLADGHHEPLFIFLDEIDAVQGLSFSVDDFFGWVRFCHSARAENPAYRRLTWALFGTATARDLVQESQETPFSVGRAVPLSGFSVSEAWPLISGLVSLAEQPEVVLTQVLRWTGGQPFLTQKVCRLLQVTVARDRPIPLGQEAQAVASLVRSRLIHPWEAQDDPEHLRTLRDRLTGDPQRVGPLLSLYRQILHQGHLKAEDSPDQAALKLSGIVIEQDGQLQVTNPIYATVFNHAWVTKVGCTLAIAPGVEPTFRRLTGVNLEDSTDKPESP